MTRILTSLIVLMACLVTISAQDKAELETQKADLEAKIAEKAGELAALEGELAGVQKELTILSGWQTGLTGLVGFDLNSSNDWIASPNPNSESSSLNIGLTAFANKEGNKAFWRNKAVVTKAWNDVDISDADNTEPEDGLFDNGTVDIFNLSSLAGYKLNNWLALSGLGEFNTSIENFFNPGTLDVGIGATLTPIENLVVVLHPLNYHVAFSGVEGIDSQGDLGLKFRADYTKSFPLASKSIAWSSTLTGFVPYGGKVQLIEDDPTTEVSLFEYTWLNTLAFEVWNGIGVGLSFGLRQADFEFDGTQNY
ncbi:MAG: DUF3078 domain-containing protein, partial [Bacteroidota bacterium]